MHRSPSPRRTPVRWVLVLVVAALVSTGVAGPAAAERYISRDPARDVQKLSFFSQDGESVRAPGRRQGDVVKVKIWHQVRAVRVVAKFRTLNRTDDAMMQVVSIRTPGGKERSFSVAAGPGLWSGVDDDAPGTDCVIGHKVNYARDRFSMRISRSCLDRPRWVRVGVGFAAIGPRAIFADDGQLRQVRDDLTYSPRLQHADPS